MRLKKISQYSLIFFILAAMASGVSAQVLPAQPSVDAAAGGEPGFSARYLTSYGVTGEPYVYSNDHLNAPMGLFVDGSGALYVAEQEGSRVIKYNAAGEYERSFGEAGAPYHHDQFLSRPSGVVVSADGNVWVAFQSAIKEYDSDGNVLQVFPADAPWEDGSGDDRLNNPYEAIFNADESRLFVSDSNNNRIQILTFDGEGKLTYDATIDGDHSVIADGGFNVPDGIAFDSLGYLYVADTMNFRIARCGYNVGEAHWECSTFIGVNGEMGDDLNHLAYASDIYIDGDDVIYIVDGINARVLKCDTLGTCNLFAGVTGEVGADNDHLSYSTAVTAVTGGNVYVSDNNNMRVQVFDHSGAYVTTFGQTRVPYVVDDQHLNQPLGVAVDTDGSLYVTEKKGFRLVKLAADGTQLWSVGEAGIVGNDQDHFGSFWGGMEGNPALDADHKVYVPDSGNNRIQVYNAQGGFETSFGEYGNGSSQFDWPSDVAIDAENGDIYVVDSGNQRVQVFTSGFAAHKATIGHTDEPGSDNETFDWPVGLALGADGSIYVGDMNNTRVQKCALTMGGYTCETIIGGQGEYNPSFGKVAPVHLAVDGDGRIYVSDEWGARVQVFSAGGAFLTSIGGESGQATSQFSTTGGLSLDAEGNLYVADVQNHRVEKFAFGVENWRQANLNGFGDQTTGEVSAVADFNGVLYAGVENTNDGAQLWRLGEDGWSMVASGGFGDSNNKAIFSLVAFQGRLYAATQNDTGDESVSDGGQIWRSASGDAGSWQQVVDNGFGSAANLSVYHLAVLGDHLYATTFNSFNGTEFYRSASGDAGDWQQIMAGGFGNSNNLFIRSLVEYEGVYYAGTDNSGIWRSTTGAPMEWDAAPTPAGWGIALLPYQGYLYAAMNDGDYRSDIWRCQACDGSDWEELIEPGFGDSQTREPSLKVFNGELYAINQNEESCLQIFKTGNGSDWQPVVTDGFGDSRNITSSRTGAAMVFDGTLYVGTRNTVNGGELWASDFIRHLFLPLIRN